MKRIEINNGAASDFNTQAELDTWKAKQIAKGMWAAEDITFEGDKPDYWKECRQMEYSKIDQDRIEAMVEKELGDSTKWDAYIALRNAIKAAYPKP